MRNVGWFLVLLAATALAQTDTTKTLGSVDFKNSCGPAVAAEFNRAVALLHSFEYDQSRDVFAEVGKNHPKCAIAKWGEAMTYFHGLWGEYDAVNGAKAAAEATRLAASNPATTAREKAYIEAISQIYGDASMKSHEHTAENKPDERGYSEPSRDAQQDYAEKMAALHKAYPDDDEATIFYALALDVTAKRGDKTHANEKACTALLNPMLAKMPNHPGVAHYLIHCNDNPDMAKDGLEAARKYAKIAPASAHATHMPAHIFAQLGLWNEVVESDKASVHAADVDAHASVCEKVGHTLHAMHFLTFSLTQRGDLKEAREVAEQAKKIPAKWPGGDKCSDHGELPLAVYILETGDWARAKEIEAKGGGYNSMLWLAKGVAAARSGDMKGAKEAEEELVKLRDSHGKHGHHVSDSPAEAIRLVVDAWIAHDSGKKHEAVDALRKAADMRDRLGGGESVFKPVREFLADMLLMDGRPQEALAEYRAVLEKQPMRFDATYGAGTAAFEAGNRESARKYYTELMKFAHGEERPEMATAKKRLAETVAAKQ
jgi:tetratricopeptide (TPR) repeat protein